MGTVPALSVGTEPHKEMIPGRPIIVIALGQVGEIVLSDWLSQLAQTGADQRLPWRAVWIGEGEAPSLPRIPFLHRLSLPVGMPDRAASQGGGIRGEIYGRFCRIDNLQKFDHIIDNYVKELRFANLSIAIVGSLAEPIIGVIGGVLQILHFNRNWDAVLALLTTDSPRSRRLGDDETYAAAREIGRFAYQGIHRMPILPLQGHAAIHKALIDYLFILEETQANTSFEQGIAQAMSEMLFLLAHCPQLWNIIQGRDIHQRNDHPVASSHTLGVLALHIPLNEMRDYFASRLAMAALYGERPGDKALLAPPSDAHEHAERDSRYLINWLKDSEPRHPLFNALFGDEPLKPQQIPHLDVYRFVETFRVKVSEGLFRLLNGQQNTDLLSQARAALTHLGNHIRSRQRSLQASHRDRSDGMRDLTSILEHWRKTTEYLHNQVSEWQSVLSPQQETPASRGLPPPIHQPRSSLKTLLEQNLAESREALEMTPGGRFRRALTADGPRHPQGVSPVDQFYEEHIRPELTQFGREESHHLKHIRQRMEWWIYLVPDREPELNFICVPPSAEWREGPPPEESRFKPTDLERLHKAVLEVASFQVQGIGDRLRGEWFRRRIREVVPTLESPQCLLSYDPDRATYLRRNVPVDMPTLCITAPDNQLADSVIQQLQNVMRQDVRHLENVEARVVLLGIWSGIPLGSIGQLQDKRRAYRTHADRLHLYDQERHAAGYENRTPIIEMETDMEARWSREEMELHTEVTMLLWDQDLVSLFFQALLYGLIERQTDSREELWWTVKSVGEFRALRLARADNPESLLEALKEWMTKPLDPNLHADPSHPFAKLDLYKKELRAAIEERRRNPNFQRDQNFLETELTQLREWANRDPRGASFLHLLECEWEHTLF